MAEKNGTNGVETKRKPFRKGEREKHLELLGKNMMLVRQYKAKLKKATDTVELVMDDLEHGGYLDDDQAQLPIQDDDQDEARA